MRSARFLGLVTLLVMAVVGSASTGRAQTDYQNYGSGDSSGGGSCQYCHGTFDMNAGVMILACTSPYPGTWGQQNCRIESYPEGTYCFTDGSDCCVD